MNRLVIFFLSIFASQLSFGQIYNSSTTSGTAGAGRAAVDIGDPSFLNPATLVHLPGRHMLFSQGKSEFAASLSEYSKDALFPAAFGYVQRKYEKGIDASMQDISLSVADNIGDRIGVGITGHYYQVRENDNPYRQSNGDIGLIYTPNERWGFAAVTYNVAGGSEEMPIAYRLAKTSAVAMNWLYRPNMRLRFDVLSAPNNNFGLMSTMLGYEIYLNKWVVARLGHQENRYEENRYASLGVGLDLPRFDINYAFVSELPRNQIERHSIDLAVSF